MRPIAELLEEVTGSPNGDAARPGAWQEISERLGELTVQDGHVVLARAAGPFRPITDPTESIIWTQMFEPLTHLVLTVVAQNPVEEYVAPLVDLAQDASKAGRIQIIRSLFEIAARSSSPAAARAGLDVLEESVREPGIELTASDDPLYWLARSTPLPEVVLPRLGALVDVDTLRSQIGPVIGAYEAAGHAVDPVLRTVAELKLEDLRPLAESPDPELVFLVVERVGTRTGALDGPTRYEVITAMPRELLTTWAVWGVEAEVYNGGFNQYFWNDAGRFAIEAVDAFEALELPQFAELMRSAISVFMEHESELRPFRDDGRLEALSASYDLRTFEAADNRFMQLAEAIEPSTALQTWLAGRLPDLATALADI